MPERRDDYDLHGQLHIKKGGVKRLL